MGCRHANCAPETLPVGETGVARARADRPEGDRPACTSLTPLTMMIMIAGAEGRGDRPVRRRSRFTLARARAEPLALQRRIARVCAASNAYDRGPAGLNPTPANHMIITSRHFWRVIAVYAYNSPHMASYEI